MQDKRDKVKAARLRKAERDAAKQKAILLGEDGEKDGETDVKDEKKE